MKIEINKTRCIRPFHLVHPATCFIPALDNPVADHRNVWMKLKEPHTSKAVNLATGELVDFTGCVSCEAVEAKVVV
ncbi:hypothetical protein [Aeromonas phage 85AhydR10PP]|nr:hypothetical protein [Aeromonas phage 85AhydR10PP]